MKKKKNFLHAEDAQSTVIGFVLITGIIIASSSIYFSSQVPDWTEGHESLHTADIADDFSELKSLIDGIVLKKGEIEPAGGAIPLKMSPDKVPIFGMSPPGSNLIFNPQDEKLELVVPTAGGGGGGGTQTWEQNATSDFNAAIKLTNVDTYSDEVKLSKLTPEGDLHLPPGETMQLGGEHSFDQVIIENTAILYVSHVTGFLKIHANNISVHSGSIITADRVGYLGGSADRIGFGPGYGANGSSDGSGGGGAGYGASGGDGQNNPVSGGIAYGNDTSTSIEIGSGGGGGGTGGFVGGSGGSGGGAIWLDAEEINIAGIISADGDYGLPGSQPQDGGGGGGSGGGIMIKGRNVTISGTLSAKGGKGGDSGGGNDGGGGGGAGGRIKIFYKSGSVPITPVGATSGGDTSDEDGGAGGNAGVYEYPGEDYTSSITHHSSGSFISEIYNTTSESTCYGNMTWDATLNGQTIVMKVRTDMFDDMRASPGWEYCPAVSKGSDVSELSSVSDSHCYVQYCAELSTDDTTTTPVLRAVKINYSLSAESPTVATSSGSIKFQSNYLYYPNQVIVYEHGAVIKWQPEGGFMLQPPPIEITKNESGSPIIEISTVDLTGANYSYSGATSTSVKNRYKSYHLLADGLKYPNLTINVTTDYPSVWEGWFNKEGTI
ncbi:hypothetical protein ES705_22148 [subsurface metagenome]